MSSSAAALQLLDLIQSHRVTALIYVAARLGIADLLADGPKSLDELVQATGADRAALARLLAALVTIGICARAGKDRYGLGDTGSALVGDASPSFKAWAILEGELLSRTWSGMLETVKTGKTAAQLQGFDNSFDLMARVPETVRVFNAAMAELTALVTADVLAAYDFSRISHLLDVGGGSGELIGAVVQRYGLFPAAKKPRLLIWPASASAIARASSRGIFSNLSRRPPTALFSRASFTTGTTHAVARSCKIAGARFRKPARCCWSSG
jgi:hypothetical protein